MDREQYRGRIERKIVGYEVDLVDGELVETPVYEERAVPSIRYAPPAPEASVAPAPQQERAAQRPRNFRGKSLAVASIFFAGAIGVTYGSDVASTYVQHQKIITPAEAYQDFTELPELAGPFIDMIQTVAKVANK